MKFQGLYPAKDDKEWSNALSSVTPEATPNNELDNLFTKKYIGGIEVTNSYTTNDRFDGVVDYRTTSITGSGLAMGARYGWERAPIAYFAGDKVGISPFPNQGDYIYPPRFDTAKMTANHYPGGDPIWTDPAKLNEILITNSQSNHVLMGADSFRFAFLLIPHTNTTTATDLKNSYDVWKNQVFAKVDATYAASTYYLGYGQQLVGDVDWNTNLPNLSYSMNFYDNFVRARAIDDVTSNGYQSSNSNTPKSCKSAQDQGLYFGGDKRFGRDFGSIVYVSNGTSQYGVWEGMHLNLDDDKNSLLKYYLSKMEWDLTKGRNWSTKKGANDAIAPIAVNKYESGHENNTTLWSQGGHGWTIHLLAYYFLTGDAKAKDIIIKVADYYASRNVPAIEFNSGGARLIGRIIEMLLAAYEVTGDPNHIYKNKILEHLNATKNAAAQLQLAPYFAPPGAWINIGETRNNPNYTNPPQKVVKSFMQLIFVHSVASALLSLEHDDPSLVAFAEEMTSYIMNKALKGGAFQNSNANSYLRYGMCYEFDPNGNCLNATGAVISYLSDGQKHINNNYLANALSVMYQLTGNDSYQLFAQTIMNEWARWGYLGGSVLVNPASSTYNQGLTCDYASTPFMVGKLGNENEYAFGKTQATIWAEQSGVAERCDGVDNNANGSIDEGRDGLSLRQSCYTGSSTTNGVGACQSGTKTCANGLYPSICSGEVLPITEIAGNNIDDDCDGLTDEASGSGGVAGGVAASSAGSIGASSSPINNTPIVGATGIMVTPISIEGNPKYKPSSSIKYIAFLQSPAGTSYTGPAKRCVNDTPETVFTNCLGSGTSITVNPTGTYVSFTASDLSSIKTFYIGVKFSSPDGIITTNVQPVTITNSVCTVGTSLPQYCGASGSGICQVGTQSCVSTSSGANWSSCSSMMCVNGALAFTPAPANNSNTMSLIANGTTYYPGATIRNLHRGDTVELRVNGSTSSSTSSATCYEGEYSLAGLSSDIIYPPGTTNTITAHVKPGFWTLGGASSLGNTLNISATVPNALTSPWIVLIMKCLKYTPSGIVDLGEIMHRITN